MIGDSTLHKPSKRQWMGKYGFRALDHGKNGNWTGYFAKYPNSTHPQTGKQMYSLWTGTDFRAADGGGCPQPTALKSIRASTAFHAHNFFESTNEIRSKYLTFGEPVPLADRMPLSNLTGDMHTAVACSHGWPAPKDRRRQFANYSFVQPAGTGPILFENPNIRQWRVDRVRQILAEDEAIYGALNVSCNGNGRCEAVTRRRG